MATVGNRISYENLDHDSWACTYEDSKATNSTTPDWYYVSAQSFVFYLKCDYDFFLASHTIVTGYYYRWDKGTWVKLFHKDYVDGGAPPNGLSETLKFYHNRLTESDNATYNYRDNEESKGCHLWKFRVEQNAGNAGHSIKIFPGVLVSKSEYDNLMCGKLIQSNGTVDNTVDGFVWYGGRTMDVPDAAAINMFSPANQKGSPILASSVHHLIHDPYYCPPPDPKDYEIGDTVILDGVECVVVSKGVPIRGRSETCIVVDKNHDLGYYCQYIGSSWGTKTVDKITKWIWGGYGSDTTALTDSFGASNPAVGWQNTQNYLSNSANASYGNAPAGLVDMTNYPSLYKGLTDFRKTHSDKWYIPSLSEFVYMSQVVSSKLSFDGSTGAADMSSVGSEVGDYYITSTQVSSSSFNGAAFEAGSASCLKILPEYVRLFRVF